MAHARHKHRTKGGALSGIHRLEAAKLPERKVKAVTGDEHGEEGRPGARHGGKIHGRVHHHKLGRKRGGHAHKHHEE